MTRLPTVLTISDLPLAELSAARLDGELFALDSCYTVVDLPVGLRERAAAVGALLPSGCIADRASAAWVHGAMPDPPTLHSASIDRDHRMHPPVLARVRFHEVRISADDVLEIGGARVTTVLRTAVDLARARGPWTAEAGAVLAGLLDASGTPAEAVVAAIEKAPGLTGRIRALQRLRTPEGPAGSIRR